jgi:hypothetical protein
VVQPAAQSNKTILSTPIRSIDFTLDYDPAPADGPALRLNKTTLASIGKWAMTGGVGGNLYSSPSFHVLRLVSSVASQGSILEIPAPYTNCTYLVEFYGPSISCRPPQFDNSSLQDYLSDVQNTPSAFEAVAYASFVPRNGMLDVNSNATVSLADGVVTGLNESLTQSGYDRTGSLARTLDNVSTDHARFYVYIFEDVTTGIECGLYNSSYTVNFTFSNGLQDVTVVNKTQLNGVNAISGSSEAHYPAIVPGTPYISVLDALQKLLYGYLIFDTGGIYVATGTGIMDSVLMDTQDMQKLFLRLGTYTPTQISIRNLTMSDALEEIFMNATLSLFGDSYFL